MSREFSLIAWGIALALSLASWAAWTSGSPPPSSLFAPRETVLVLAVEVVSGRQNGSLRHVPSVTVEWQDAPHALAGLRSSFAGFDFGSAQAAVEPLALGDEISVRLVDGQIFLDRNDWFRLGAAIWLTLCAIATFSFVTLQTLPRRRRKLS